MKKKNAIYASLILSQSDFIRFSGDVYINIERLKTSTLTDLQMIYLQCSVA